MNEPAANVVPCRGHTHDRRVTHMTDELESFKDFIEQRAA